MFLSSVDWNINLDLPPLNTPMMMMKLMTRRRRTRLMMMTNLWRACVGAHLSHGTRAVMGSRSQPNNQIFSISASFHSSLLPGSGLLGVFLAAQSALLVAWVEPDSLTGSCRGLVWIGDIHLGPILNQILRRVLDMAGLLISILDSWATPTLP